MNALEISGLFPYCFTIERRAARALGTPLTALTKTILSETIMAAQSKPEITRDRKSLTQERLKELLHYDSETGIFTRRVDRPAGKFALAGMVVGSVEKKGYLTVYIEGYSYKLHILAWFYMKGTWPQNQIDHIDLDKSNNRFLNLRGATNGQNKANAPLPKNNTTGFKRVRYHKPNGRWQATGKGGVSLGYYETAAEAGRVAADYGAKIYGEFYRET